MCIISLTLGLLCGLGGSLLCLLSFLGWLGLGSGSLGDGSRGDLGGLGLTLLHRRILGLLGHRRFGSSGDSCLTLLKLSQFLLQLVLALLQSSNLEFVNI